MKILPKKIKLVRPKVSVVKMTCFVSGINIFAKLAGFVEKLVVAHYFGSSDVADVYFASSTIVFSIVLLVKELVNPTLLPVFIKTLNEKGQDYAGILFRKTFGITSILLIIVALVLGLQSDWAVVIFAGGFSTVKRNMMASLLSSLAPMIVSYGLCMVTYTVLNSHKRFVQAALPEAFLKVIVVLGLILYATDLGIRAYALSLFLGSLVCLVMHVYFVPERKYFLKRTVVVPNDKNLRRVLMLMAPLVVGVLFSHGSRLVNNYIASCLPTGQMSYLGYARKLIDSILIIGPVALTTVIFSHLAHVSSGRIDSRFSDLISKAIRLVVYLILPISALLIALHQPLIRCLMERGEFGPESTRGTSNAFLIYALGLTLLSLEPLFISSFFSLSDTRTPVKWGIVCTIVNIALAVMLVPYIEFYGIAIAFVVSRGVKVMILGINLHLRLGGLFDRDICCFFLKQLVVSFAVWRIATWILVEDYPRSVLVMFIQDLLLPSLGALIAFGIGSILLRIPERRILLAFIKHRGDMKKN